MVAVHSPVKYIGSICKWKYIGKRFEKDRQPVNGKKEAAKEHHAGTITLTGGVAANSLLRTQLTEKAARHNINVFTPSLQLCTDNAAMIAFAGLKRISSYNSFPYPLNAISRWPL